MVFGTDNTGVVFGLNAGRVHAHARRALMRELADLQERYQFEVIGRWIPRELNEVADGLSRQRSYRQAMGVAFPARAA